MHSFLLSDWRRTVSSKFFPTQVLSVSTKKLVVPRLTGCVLSHLCCKGHRFLLNSHPGRNGKSENPSCSTCDYQIQNISHLILYCPVTNFLCRSLFGTLSLSTISGPGYWCWPGAGAPWSSAMFLSLRRGRITTTKTVKSSRQACLLCPSARHLTGHLHLYVADRWRTPTSPGYNCEDANPACRKRRLLGTHQWQSTLLVVGLPLIHDWFEMGCHLSPSLISIRLTA